MPHRVNHNLLGQTSPLLHTLAAWSAGVADSYLHGYFCDPIGNPIRSNQTGLPMVTKTLTLDASETGPVALLDLMAAIDAECANQASFGPWPTGFVVQKVENGAAHVHTGVSEEASYGWTGVAHMSADVSSYVIPIGDYSANPIVIGYGSAMDLRSVKQVEILTPSGSDPIRVEVADPGVGIGFNLTASGTIVSAPGKLLGFAIVNPAAGSTVTFHDGTSGSDPVVFGPITGASVVPWVPVNRAFSVGLHAVFAGGAPTLIGTRGPL